MTSDLLRPAEVARRLGVSRSWLYEAAKSGAIPCVRLGGDGGPLRFVEQDIDLWLSLARTKGRGSMSSATAPARAELRNTIHP